MEKVEPADVVFYRPEGLIGWIISKVSRSEYSHVSIAISPTQVMEANRFIESRVADLDYNKKIHHVYRLQGLTEEQRLAIVQSSLEMLGYKYDYKQIFGLFLRLVFDFRYSTFNNLNKYICSEVIDRAFLLAGVPRKDKEWICNVTPQELLEKYELQRIM